MTYEDRQYYRQRLFTERAFAEAASHPNVIRIHRELAERYEALVGEGNRPSLRIITTATRISVAA